MTYCESEGIFADEQNGFSENRSSTDHIFTLTSLVRNRMASKVPTFSCLIDLQKAFDWVDRDLLFYKLLQYNIDGNMYKAVRALYSKPLSCVRLNEVNTEWFETTSGVKQGE